MVSNTHKNEIGSQITVLMKQFTVIRSNNLVELTFEMLIMFIQFGTEDRMKLEELDTK